MSARILTVSIIAGMVILNLLLTLQNIWPTPWVYPVAELSVELAIVTLGLAVWREFRPGSEHLMRRIALCVLLLLIAGRYADITAPALFGRRIDLFWDIRHLPSLFSMLGNAAPAWQIALGGTAVAASVIALVLAVRAIVSGILNGFAVAKIRRAAAALSVLAIGLYGAAWAGMPGINLRWFALPVTPVYAQQAMFLTRAFQAGTAHDDPQTPSNLKAIAGADAFALFLESYGAIVFERKAMRAAVAGDLAHLGDFLNRSGWHVASAYVDAPTFGGASWLSHASFLSGRWITREAEYRLFLAAPPRTLTARFRDAGYRTVGLFPGIKLDWPEGAALGFDRIFDARSLSYPGPAFGWWTIPDQYSLEQLNRRELSRAGRKPLFVTFASIMSHWPFGPTPPYQDDWSRLAGAAPYSGDAVDDALAVKPLDDITASYLRTIRHNFRLVGGFLEQRAPRDALVLVAGDHQPPAVISGKAASWSVPVHVFTRDAALLRRFTAAGFRPGLTPRRPTLTRMDGLHHLLLQALDSKARLAAKP